MMSERENGCYDEQPLQGTCKDCGNGTLNNNLNPQFTVDEYTVYCLRCGSSHVDVL